MSDSAPVLSPVAPADEAKRQRNGYSPQARLPHEPYPGLRPFLDFEAALLFGRERQVREVIDRLRQTQFVAVLGGSGSGKSSLVHAGVVPALRSYGIPGAGDLWLPMTCTPGTNVSVADSASGLHSPVSRLARRFAGLLTSRGSAQLDAERLQQIASIFRQDAGFARLLDTFGPELAVPPGPDPSQACVLFVLDQFEELFHPTNSGVKDAALLVERVLDHFFNPHPRCYVVLTMRSEHLNDCAAYLELPDAINKSSYLIRRLDAAELREAIVGPAQRFLRLVSRNNTADLPLPVEVVFEEPVLQRLLRDVQAITQDPDHLPLLQHLLARLWEAALQRERRALQAVDKQSAAGSAENANAVTASTAALTNPPALQVPGHITQADLLQAVSAQAPGLGAWPELPEATNTLRASAENWPETVYLLHSKEARAQLDRLLQKLAFKDPNTGLYLQQRVVVDELLAAQSASQLAASTRENSDPQLQQQRSQLRTLIGEGFLGSVDYLYWDSEDPSRVSLKVSHEAFIRGWSRFRGAVDVEALRLGEYTTLLRKCADWQDNHRTDDDLLEATELRRLSDSGFAMRLMQPAQRADWQRLLALHRDGPRLVAAAPEAQAFMDQSVQRQQARRQRETRAKRSLVAAAALLVVFALLPTAFFSWAVQTPTMSRAELLFAAGNRANGALLKSDQATVGGGAGTLDQVLMAAQEVSLARAGEGTLAGQASKALLQRWGDWPPFENQRDFLDAVFLQAEPPVNGSLRRLLTETVWRAGPALPQDATAARLLPAPQKLLDASCQLDPANPAPEASASADTAAPLSSTGTLFVVPQPTPEAGQANTTRVQRAVFVPNQKVDDLRLQVFSASVGPGRTCHLGALVLDAVATSQSVVAIDASLRFFYQTLEIAPGVASIVQVQELDWERLPNQRVQALPRTAIAVLTDPGAVAAVKAAMKDSLSNSPAGARVSVVPTWRVAGGRVVKMGDKHWRLVAQQAQRVDALPSGLLPLPLAAPDSMCAQLGALLKPVPGFRVWTHQHGSNCVRVAVAEPATREPSSRETSAAASKGAGTQNASAQNVSAQTVLDSTLDPGNQARVEVHVAVHTQPTAAVLASAETNPPAPVAYFVPYTRVQMPAAYGEPLRWLVMPEAAANSAQANFTGWLFLDTPDSTGRSRVVGAPWGTCALWRLGRDVQRGNAGAAAGAPAAGQPLMKAAPSSGCTGP
jgi:hypothetical protein